MVSLSPELLGNGDHCPAQQEGHNQQTATSVKHLQAIAQHNYEGDEVLKGELLLHQHDDGEYQARHCTNAVDEEVDFNRFIKPLLEGEFSCTFVIHREWQEDPRLLLRYQVKTKVIQYSVVQAIWIPSPVTSC